MTDATTTTAASPYNGIAFTAESIGRAAAGLRSFKGIYIPTPSHIAIQGACELLRISNQNTGDAPKGALRLSQLSGASKTTLFVNHIKTVRERHEKQTGTDNPNLIMFLPLTSVTTPKMVCQDICRRLGDENWAVGTTEQVINRMKMFIEKAGVELIIIDEVQHLKGRNSNRQDVSDLFKSLLNLGIVPIVFVGDETSVEMFTDNVHLGNRTGAPLRLDPIKAGDKERLPEFKHFCTALEAEMISRKVLRQTGILSTNSGMKQLLQWSAGFLGRVSRIVAQALEHALLRNAATIEQIDLDHAIQNFAIPNNYRHAVGV